MLERTREYIENSDLFSLSARLLVTLSGGVDSMVCLDILHRLGYECGIAHCNFQLRGSESNEDEKFVTSVSNRLKIPFHCQVFNTQEYANQNGVSIQMAARDLRYTWFESIRLSEKYDYIILAHHADDSVETMLINLARGTGLKGLTGIQASSGKIRRPLLYASRYDILTYAKQNNLSFREDSSNLKTDYTRNRIRHIILPEFEKINPSFSQSVLSTIEHLNQEQVVLDQKYFELKEVVVKEDAEDIILSIQELSKLQHIDWFMYRFLSAYGFNSEQVSSLINVLSEPPGKRFFSERYSLVKDREYIYLTKLDEETEGEFFIDAFVKSVSDPISLEIRKIPKSQHSLSPNPNITSIDFQKISFPLILRKWIPGDYFYPLGMKKAKKLSDFFIDEKIPRHKKERIWILCSGEDIVWIVGLRMDDRFKLTEDTSMVFQIEQKL